MALREADLYERELDRFRDTLRMDVNLALKRYGMTMINSLNPAERVATLQQLGVEIHEAVDFYNLGCQAADDENWSEAIVHFKRAIEMDSSLNQAIYNMAICYERTGHVPQAKSTWQVYASTCKDADEKARVQEHLADL